MTGIFGTVLLMMAVLAAVAVAARRLHIAPSILLVVAGVAVAFVPGLPKVSLAPELVLLVILPPLIYSAGVSMSWREFRFNLRPISLLAFGCVVFTTCAIAAAVHYLLHFEWPVAFVLGGLLVTAIGLSIRYATLDDETRATFNLLRTRPGPKLEPRQIVVAPFENKTGESQ